MLLLLAAAPLLPTSGFGIPLAVAAAGLAIVGTEMHFRSVSFVANRQLGWLSLVTGAAMLTAWLWPVLPMAWLAGAWLLTKGAITLGNLGRASFSRGWMIMQAAVDLVFGLFLLAADPVPARAFLAFMVGLSLALWGLALFADGFSRRPL